MPFSAINASTAPPALGGYSQAIEVRAPARWLFVSGQIPETVAGDIPAEFEPQARLVWAHVVAQLQAAGMTTTNLVKVTTFLASREVAESSSAIRREILGQHAPALTVIITDIFDCNDPSRGQFRRSAGVEPRRV